MKDQGSAKDGNQGGIRLSGVPKQLKVPKGVVRDIRTASKMLQTFNRYGGAKRLAEISSAARIIKEQQDGMARALRSISLGPFHELPAGSFMSGLAELAAGPGIPETFRTLSQAHKEIGQLFTHFGASAFMESPDLGLHRFSGSLSDPSKGALIGLSSTGVRPKGTRFPQNNIGPNPIRPKIHPNHEPSRRSPAFNWGNPEGGELLLDFLVADVVQKNSGDQLPQGDLRGFVMFLMRNEPQRLCELLDGVGETSQVAPYEASIPLFRWQGDVIEIEYEGTACSFMRAKGFQYLQALIEHPGMTMTAMELKFLIEGHNPDNAPRLSINTAEGFDKEEFRNRLLDLEREIDLAEKNNDLERLRRYQSERHCLLEELPGKLENKKRIGRDNPDHELVRKSVGNAINRAVGKIFKKNQSLGSHLKSAVTMGHSCSYEKPRIYH